MEKWALRLLLKWIGQLPISIVLGSGERFLCEGMQPVTGIRIKDRLTLLRLICNPDVQLGHAYSSGRIEVEGDLVTLLESVFRSVLAQESFQAAHGRSGRGNRLFPSQWHKRLLRPADAGGTNTLRGSRNNIHRHYDIGNDFYRLWLDSELVYTCAYFESPADTLEQAQRAKMDYVCRKVQLQPGETVVEAGCGWGALALHMAKHYGVAVRAFNISREQILYARQRARDEGLSGRVEFIEDDYRNISGRFDAFVSVGMLEHVGLRHYDELGNVIHRCLDRSGRGLLHFIGRDRERPLNAWIRKRIFPGAYPPTLREAARIFEPRSLSVLDVENLRLHYAKTLEHWLERFENSQDIVARMFDREFVRSWRLYLAGSLAAFRTGWLQLFQVTFTHAANNQIPWTRAYLYKRDTVQARYESSVIGHRSPDAPLPTR